MRVEDEEAVPDGMEEVVVPDGMKEVHKRISETAYFLCVGWTLIMVGIIGFQSPIIAFLGVFIGPLPMFRRMMAGGFGAMFNMPEYEVISTDAHGRKSSDGGYQSAVINLIFKCILIVVGIAIGIFASLAYLVILLIRYLVLYAEAVPKPTFMKSAFMIYAMVVVVFFGAMILGGVTEKVRRNVLAKQWAKESAPLIKAVENADKHPITAYTLSMSKRSKYALMSIWDETVDPPKHIEDKFINKGEEVTIISPYSKDHYGVLVRYGDDVGYISISSLSFEPPKR